MKKEYLVILLTGLFILTYVLDSITVPLGTQLTLASPFLYFNPATASLYPFTTASIFLKAIALSLIPPLILSFIKGKPFIKAVVITILAALTELYVIQDLAAGTQLMPLEWDLAFSLSGIFLLPYITSYLFKGIFYLLIGDQPIPKSTSDDSDSPKSFDL